VLAGGAPVQRSELEQAVHGPARDQAEDVAQVAPGLDAVELAAREQGDEVGIDLCGVVAADEEPVLPADDLATELALGAAVVDGEAAVVQ